MKNKMEDFVKNIIVEKSYFELTPKEKEIVQDWASNEEEFDALKMTFLAVSDFNIENEKQLTPNVKQRLNERFSAKHAVKTDGFLNRFLIFFFPRDTHVFKKPAFQLAMIALIVALVIPFLWQENPAQYAMNEENEKLEVERVQPKKVSETNETHNKVELKELIENSSAEIKEVSVDQPKRVVPQAVKEQEQESTTLKSDDTEEIYLEEIVQVPSTSKMDAELQQLDDLPMISRKDANVEYKTPSSKQVEASETLALLTALY
ncbi:hypothetical protein [Brumimicrobium oceani]|uniref:Uncharacterized protein n=1 Tax=Brumimicrobium oceani TaxID=2100725 RepID=A0A2U2XF78_9FLAO|nr:hypothetical protein [Brumimicrobium oceani]PWH86361.1 hypothetical protein DIT68_03730 [Brumimicrobium oceani]